MSDRDPSAAGSGSSAGGNAVTTSTPSKEVSLDPTITSGERGRTRDGSGPTRGVTRAKSSGRDRSVPRKPGERVHAYAGEHDIDRRTENEKREERRRVKEAVRQRALAHSRPYNTDAYVHWAAVAGRSFFTLFLEYHIYIFRNPLRGASILPESCSTN